MAISRVYGILFIHDYANKKGATAKLTQNIADLSEAPQGPVVNLNTRGRIPETRLCGFSLNASGIVFETDKKVFLKQVHWNRPESLTKMRCFRKCLF